MAHFLVRVTKLAATISITIACGSSHEESAGASAADASDASDGTVLFGGCVYECGEPMLDFASTGCPTLACQLLPLTLLECFCGREAGLGCPETIEAGLDRLRTACETDMGRANSRIYHCAGRSVTVVAVSGGLWEIDYFFEATGALIGVTTRSDTDSGPCRSIWSGAGDVACNPIDACAPCPSDAGAPTGIPACADVAL